MTKRKTVGTIYNLMNEESLDDHFHNCTNTNIDEEQSDELMKIGSLDDHFLN